MEKPSVDVEPPIYQHRLTGAGKLGAAAFLICPIIFGALLPDFLYGRSYDRTPAAIMIILAIGSQLGAVMLFVGREYVPISQAERREAEERLSASTASREETPSIEITRRY